MAKSAPKAGKIFTHDEIVNFKGDCNIKFVHDISDDGKLKILLELDNYDATFLFNPGDDECYPDFTQIDVKDDKLNWKEWDPNYAKGFTLFESEKKELFISRDFANVESNAFTNLYNIMGYDLKLQYPSVNPFQKVVEKKEFDYENLSKNDIQRQIEAGLQEQSNVVENNIKVEDSLVDLLQKKISDMESELEVLKKALNVLKK